MIVIIENFDGQRMGTVTRRSDGSLAILGETPELSKQLHASLGPLIERTLSLREEYRDAKSANSFGTQVRHLRPDEPDFLLALADAIASERLEIGGIRLRGYVIGPKTS